MWRAGHDPSVLAVAAEPVRAEDPDRFDLDGLDVASTVVRLDDGRERLSVTNGVRRIRLNVESGTVLAGAVRFHYQLSGLEDVEAKLVTLRRLLALARLGRIPRRLKAAELRRNDKLILALKAHDLAAAGATQREIAIELMGGARAAADWRAGSDSLRYRVLRLLRNANAYVNGGHLTLLRD